ncbi:glycoside hydrolase family 3 protein [Rhodobacteraceae bacterium CCMM004]|nr:glycoside hydrolase family 3 protein [Rhodobacteraceae bacterium CCMM004]
MMSAAILGPEGPRLEADERAFFAEAQPWGFILFARNVEDPAQLRRLTGDLRAAVGRDAPILVDQEGGRVQRLRAPHWREWRPPLDFVRAAGPEDAPRAMWLRGRLIADELAAVGIDVNCTPCADLARPETHPFLHNRCYGGTPETVAELSHSLAEGQAAGGVLSVMKHLPGHGRATLDSHHHLPRIDATEADLEGDFATFRALADLPMAMTAHIVLEALSDRPATHDPAMIALIRERIGFAGLLMTDDLSMEALGGDVSARAGQAIAAGCDLALHCNGKRAEMERVVAAAGPLTGAAAARAEAALAARPAPEPLDPAAAEAELAALLAPRHDG